MSPDQRFTLIMSGIAILASAIGWLAKSFMGVSKQWTLTGERLERLGLDLRQVVDWKDREHGRIELRVERVDNKLERHEVWHDDHPYHSGP